MGTDLEADFQEIKILDLSNATGDDVIRYKMRFQGDTNVAIGAECVLYK